MKTPPLGIMPKFIWETKRYNALNAAIARYHNAQLVIPVEWVTERNELLLKLKEEYK